MIEDIIKEEIQKQTGIDIKVKSRKREVVEARAIFFKIALKYLHLSRPTNYLGMNRTNAYNYIKQEHYLFPDFAWKNELYHIEKAVDYLLQGSDNTNLYEIKITTKGEQKTLQAYSSIGIDDAIQRIKDSVEQDTPSGIANY